MLKFGITTDITEDLGKTIGFEGNNFEDQIHTIQAKIDECASSWTNGGYDAFKNQTTKAAEELNILRDFFKQYGINVVDFANQSQESIDRVATVINNNSI